MNTKTYSNWQKWLIAIAIFGGFGLSQICSPIVQKLVSAYPDTAVATIRQVTTIPSLMSCLVGMVLSLFVGKQVSYKTALVAGLALCAVGGTMPAFCNATFTIVIIARIIYGFGFSVLAMRNPIIAKAVGEEESAKWIGHGMSIANISSVVCIYKRFQARESGDNNFFNGSAQWRCSRRSVSDTVLVYKTCRVIRKLRSNPVFICGCRNSGAADLRADLPEKTLASVDKVTHARRTFWHAAGRVIVLDLRQPASLRPLPCPAHAKPD